MARNAAAAPLGGVRREGGGVGSGPVLAAGGLRREGGGMGSDPVLAADVLGRLARILQALRFDVRGARVVELGPGRSPELSASLLLAGAAEATLLDTDLRIPDDARRAGRYE